MRRWRSKRSRAGHLLMEALAGGVILSLTLAALASGEVESRRSLARGIDDLEMERAATERLEFLRAQPPNSPVWARPSSGTVQGHPEWAWSIVPEFVEDPNVRMGFSSIHYMRAKVTITAGDGHSVVREVLRW
ncbi:MAG: hypothetical protein ACJ8AT_28245 [Hyalangium sp.]|uniref:type IV pilus modification PilV family protein n=1 Tax=Hyalangium sp. TaxID=2028555 RepID=UPI003899B2ED